MMNSVNIIGAGLAGSEAALYLAKSGIAVNLYDMKPNTHSPVYSLDTFCELVCNNLLCDAKSHTPHNLLYRELELLGSEVVKLIEQARIQDSVSVAVDKRHLSQLVTEAIRSNKNIHVFEQEIVEIPDGRPTIIATGPITGSRLLSAIENRFHNMIQIKDANSIILSFDSIDKSKMESISDDVFYVHLTNEEYRSLEEALKNAKTSTPHNPADLVITHCQTVEMLAQKSGSLAKSKLEPMQRDIAATIILRKDDKLSNSVVISKFTTRMTKIAQEAIVHSIHGLENARFVRYGQLHYNTFVDAPRILNNHYEVIADSGLYIIGQLAGIDGYLPAISSAIVAARSIVAKLNGIEPVSPEFITMTGALSKYVSTPSKSLTYEPTIPLFELILTKEEQDKKYDKAIQSMKRFIE